MDFFIMERAFLLEPLRCYPSEGKVSPFVKSLIMQVVSSTQNSHIEEYKTYEQ